MDPVNAIWVMQVMQPTVSGHPITINPSGGLVNLASVTSFLNYNTSTLPSSVSGDMMFVGGGFISVSGRMMFGDGSGWQFKMSSRTGSVTSDCFTFYDNGTLSIGYGINLFGSPLGTTVLTTYYETLVTATVTGAARRTLY